MAEFNTAVYNAQKPDRANPSRLAQPNSASGNLEHFKVAYTLVGSEVANDIINLGILPAGMIPVLEQSSVTCADPGTTLTLNIGTAALFNGWAAGIVLSAGGQVACTSTAIPVWIADTPLVADAGTLTTAGSAKVYATVATAASLTPGVVLYFNLAYKKAK